MQKLDYIENIKLILESLKTQFFLEFYNKTLKQPTTPTNFASLIPSLFDSKSEIEKLKQNKNIFIILETLGAFKIFSSENLTWLTTLFNQVSLNNLFNEKSAIDFFMFHKSLHSINILNNELFNLQLIEENETSNGVAVFRIINQESEPTIERFIQIFKSLEELSIIFKKVHNDDSETKIYLLDSGSDTNLGLDTGVKVAKSLYLIFKEIWEYSFNRKQYKNSKNNEALLESLTIRAEIKKKREEGVITENEEIEYSHIVKTRVETLLGMNVVTKDIFDKFPENDTLRLSLVSFNHKLLSKENSLED